MEDSFVWFCNTCNESVVHKHKLKKPTYEELATYVETLTNVVAFSNAQYATYQEMVKRLREGR